MNEIRHWLPAAALLAIAFALGVGVSHWAAAPPAVEPFEPLPKNPLQPQSTPVGAEAWPAVLYRPDAQVTVAVDPQDRERVRVVTPPRSFDSVFPLELGRPLRALRAGELLLFQAYARCDTPCRLTIALRGGTAEGPRDLSPPVRVSLGDGWQQVTCWFRVPTADRAPSCSILFDHTSGACELSHVRLTEASWLGHLTPLPNVPPGETRLRAVSTSGPPITQRRLHRSRDGSPR